MPETDEKMLSLPISRLIADGNQLKYQLLKTDYKLYISLTKEKKPTKLLFDNPSTYN